MSVYLAMAISAASVVNESAKLMEEWRAAIMTPEQRADYFRKREVEALERQARASEKAAEAAMIQANTERYKSYL